MPGGNYRRNRNPEDPERRSEQQSKDKQLMKDISAALGGGNRQNNPGQSDKEKATIKKMEEDLGFSLGSEKGAPKEPSMRHKKVDEDEKRKPGYQSSNKELANTFGGKELGDIKAVKKSVEGGDVGGPEDARDNKTEIEDLRRTLDQGNFSRLKFFQSLTASGKIGGVQDKPEQEHFIVSKEIPEEERVKGTLDEETAETIRAIVEGKLPPFIRATLVDSLIKYSSLNTIEKTGVVEAVRSSPERYELCKKLLKHINLQPLNEAFYSLYEEVSNYSDLDLQLGQLLLGDKIPVTPGTLIIRDIIVGTLARSKSIEAVEILRKYAEQISTSYGDVTEGRMHSDIYRSKDYASIIEALSKLEGAFQETAEAEDSIGLLTSVKNEVANYMTVSDERVKEWKEANPGWTLARQPVVVGAQEKESFDVSEIVAEWKNHAKNWGDTEKRFALQIILKEQQGKLVAEEAFKELGKNPDATELYELYADLADLAPPEYTERLADKLLSDEICLDPAKRDIRQNIIKAMVQSVLPESVDILFAYVEKVKSCNYQESSDAPQDPPELLKLKDQELVLGFLDELENDLNALGGSEAMAAVNELPALREVIDNNKEAAAEQYRKWLDEHR